MRLQHLYPVLRSTARPLTGIRSSNSAQFLRDSRTRYSNNQTMATTAQTSSDAAAAAAPRSMASLTSPPAADQLISHNSKSYTTVKEGLAYILVPPDAPRELDPKTHGPTEPAQSVFYNPIQQYNRDLTILAIRAFGEDFLARNALKKARKGQRGGGKGRKRDVEMVEGKRESSENAVGADGAVSGPAASGAAAEIASEEVKAGSFEATNSRKRKLTGDESAGTESEGKKVKLVSDTGEFEDSKITDEDLLAIESSFAPEPPFSTAKETSDYPLESAQTPGAAAANAARTRTAQNEDVRPPFKILDALSATGLRALRYAKELPFATQITANDLSKAAVETIKLNIAHNQLGDTVKTSTGNANSHMYNFVGREGSGGPGQKYQVIDLDPYGTAVPFLDAAVQALADGGLLCVTCTDTGVFNSMGYAEKAFSLYGGLPGKGDHCHEIGLRLILNCIATTAAKYGIAIEPLLSLSIDYYARVFVRLRKSPRDVKFHGSKTMLVYACDHGCGAWQTQFLMRTQQQESKKGVPWHKYTVSQGPSADRLCECCGSKMHVAGPMYGGPLHNPSFIRRVLNLIPNLDKETYKTLPRLEGMLSLAQEEMSIHNMAKLTVPFEMPKGASTSEVKQDIKTTNGESKGTSTDEPAEPDVALTEDNPETKIAEAQGKPAEDHSMKIFESMNPTAQDFHPFYIVPSSLSRIVRCPSPPDAAFRGALRGLGFQAVKSHALPGTIKTDAPWEALWDIMAAWVKQLPHRPDALREGMAGYQVLKRAEERESAREELASKTVAVASTNSLTSPTMTNGGGAQENMTTGTTGDRKDIDQQQTKPWKIVFDEKLGSEQLKNKRLVRYQVNPRANWGPMARAK